MAKGEHQAFSTIAGAKRRSVVFTMGGFSGPQVLGRGPNPQIVQLHQA